MNTLNRDIGQISFCDLITFFITMQEDSTDYDADDEWEVETIQEIIYLLNYTIEHYKSLVEYNQKEGVLYNYINLKNGRNTTLKYKCSLAKYKWIEKWIQKP